MIFIRSLHAWLMATFVGSRGYTLYGTGQIERCSGQIERGAALDGGDPASLDLDQFQSVFGDDAEVSDEHFYVPESGLAGTVSRVNGRLAANADFVWNRAGIRTSPYVVWMCLLGFLVDLLNGVLVLMQGDMTAGKGAVITLTLITFVCLMFLPRLMIELMGRMFHDQRSQAIAKLSALLQHEAGQRSVRGESEQT